MDKRQWINNTTQGLACTSPQVFKKGNVLLRVGPASQWGSDTGTQVLVSTGARAKALVGARASSACAWTCPWNWRPLAPAGWTAVGVALAHTLLGVPEPSGSFPGAAAETRASRGGLFWSLPGRRSGRCGVSTLWGAPSALFPRLGGCKSSLCSDCEERLNPVCSRGASSKGGALLESKGHLYCCPLKPVRGCR